jgi:UDP-N-acetylmuramoyl-tripeptide--D-alanyl-D-alanine ligase
MTEVWLAFAVALIPWTVVAFLRLKRFLHILQLEEYLTPEYRRWLDANGRRFLGKNVLAGSFLAVIAGAVVTKQDAGDGAAVGAIVVWGLAAALVYRKAPQPRKPLIMTARARRLLAIGLAVDVVIVALAAGVGLLINERAAVAAAMLTVVLTSVLGGHVLLLANLVLWPLEERARRRWQAMAADKLRSNRPRIIAITGSAGKTTTKDLVAHLISARYRVLKTPASFNTPLGIARTVNDSYEGQDYFVVEMGAYKRGEIARLCELVDGTDVSVITTVNAQHLERFGSLEATAVAKFEIVEGLRPGGTAVLNFDVPAIRERAAAHLRGPHAERMNVLSFGVESDDVTLRGANLLETPTGIELDATYYGETVHVKTQLLARHNATNVLAAIGVGLACGLELGYMAAAIGRAAAPEHRLQPLQMANGVTVLDDGYNANPDGILGALEVLGAYKPRRRVLVTSGLIEMGREKAAYHARIGEAAAANADVAVLIGPKQTSDIREAMLSASFPAECLHVARNPDEAQAVLARLAQPGDVILHSTDLPDQFDEFLVI